MSAFQQLPKRNLAMKKSQGLGNLFGQQNQFFAPKTIELQDHTNRPPQMNLGGFMNV